MSRASAVETLLARTILAGDVSAGDTLTVDISNGELTVQAAAVA